MIVHISYCIAQEYQWKLMDLLPQKTLIEDNCWYDQRGEFAIMPQIILMCTLNHYYYPPYISTYYYLACTCLDFQNNNGISVQETQQMSKSHSYRPNWETPSKFGSHVCSSAYKSFCTQHMQSIHINIIQCTL